MKVYSIHYYVNGELVESYHPTRFEAETFSRFAWTLGANEGTCVTLFEATLKNSDLINLLCVALSGVIVVEHVAELRRWRVPNRDANRLAIMDAYIENLDDEHGRILQTRGM